jgi:hypothetical protein
MNENVATAIMQLLKLDQSGRIPEDAPISFTVPGVQQILPDEAPEGRIGVEMGEDEEIDDEANPMLAAVLDKVASPVRPAPLRFDNGEAVTPSSQARRIAADKAKKK